MSNKVLVLPALLAVLLPVCFFFSCTSTPKPDDSSLIRQMDALLDRKEYFRLEQQLDLYSAGLSSARRLYFAAILDNAFNRNVSCIARIDSVMSQQPAVWPDSLKVRLLGVQGDSYFKTGQYMLAARIDSLLIHRYDKAMDSDALSSVKNDWSIRNALRNTPPQEVVTDTGSALTWSRNGIGLMEIPLQSDNQTVNAIFDTRANISSITRSYAQKLHLHLLDVNYTEGSGITGIKFTVSLGVADSLYIGHVLVRNAVFQVMPDSIFYIAPIHFHMNIIVGLPIIAGLREVRLYADGRMIIPAAPMPGDGHNLLLDGLDPVVSLVSGGDTLLYYFDSGATTSVLYYSYLNTHHAAILRSAIKKKTGFGGAGGVKVSETYVLPTFQLTLDHKTLTVDSVSVMTEKISPEERFYGNIGQDFMRQFQQLTINFQYMYVKGM